MTPAGSTAIVETAVDASATTSGGVPPEVAARDQRPDRVAERHRNDGERGEELPLRLRADEQRDPDEADDEPDAGAGRRPAPPGRTRTRAAR